MSLPCEWQGPKSLYHQLPPMVHISRELELEVDLGFQLRHSGNGLRASPSLTAVANTCSLISSVISLKTYSTLLPSFGSTLTEYSEASFHIVLATFYFVTAVHGIPWLCPAHKMPGNYNRLVYEESLLTKLVQMRIKKRKRNIQPTSLDFLCLKSSQNSRQVTDTLKCCGFVCLFVLVIKTNNQ